MAKPWSAVEQSPDFQALSSDQKEEARNQYFLDVVAPQVPTDALDSVRAEFDADTKPTLTKTVTKAVTSALTPAKSISEQAAEISAGAQDRAAPSTNLSPLSEQGYNTIANVVRNNGTALNVNSPIDEAVNRQVGINQPVLGQDEKPAPGKDLISRAAVTAGNDAQTQGKLQTGADAVANMKAAYDADQQSFKTFRNQHELVSGLQSGAAQIAGSLADIPQFAADTVNNVAVNPFLNLFGLNSLQPAHRFQVAKDLETAAGNYRPDIANKPISHLRGAGEVSDWIATQAAIQAPQMVGSTAAAFLPKLRAAYLGLMGVSSGAQQYQQDLEKKVNPRSAWLDGVSNGAFEVLGEALPFEAFDKIGSVIRKLPVSQRAPAISEALKKTLVAVGAMAGQHASEGIGEGITQLGQNASQRYIAGDKTQGLMDQVPEAAAIGAIMATPMAIPHAYHAAKQPQSNEAELAQALQQNIDTGTFDPNAIHQEALTRLSPTGTLPAPFPSAPAGSLSSAANIAAAHGINANGDLHASTVLGTPEPEISPTNQQGDNHVLQTTKEQQSVTPSGTASSAQQRPGSVTDGTDNAAGGRKAAALAFNDPYEEKLAQHYQSAKEAAEAAGIPKEHADVLAESLKPKADLDHVTGYFRGEEKVPTVRRAQAFVEKTGVTAHYIDGDVINLGGINEYFKNDAEKANKVYRAFSDIFRDEMERAGAKKIMVRQGGDEVSSVVLGGTDESIKKAAENTSARTREYAKSIGLGDIPYAKAKGDNTPHGTGMHIGFTRILPGEPLSEIFERASQGLDASKKRGGNNVSRVEAGAPENRGAVQERSAGVREGNSRVRPASAIIDRGIQPEAHSASPATAESRLTSKQADGIPGKHTEVVLPDSRTLPAQWQVVDADQVKATLKEGQNQPRDRSRAASNVQVQGIANNPNYSLLRDSPVMDFGAPTLSHEGAIVGGNGRFEGISRAYDQGSAKDYRAKLEADAADKGIDPASFAGMKKPVLVRRITQPFDTRALAVASNSGGSLQYSALEQAKIDGDRMNGLGDIEVNDAGDVVMSADNMQNVRRALAGYTPAELGSMTDKDGMLSQEGVRRIKNALLYKAYGNSSVLSRLVESTDTDMRNVMAALVKSAGAVASVRADMQQGNKSASSDIVSDLLSAIEQLAKLKADGVSIEQYFAQQQMFGKGYSEETASILLFLNNNIRSQKRMAEFIRAYYDGLANEDHLTGSMFDTETVTNKERLSHVINETQQQHPESGSAGEVRPQAGEQPESAQGTAESGREGQQDTGLTPSAAPVAPKPAERREPANKERRTRYATMSREEIIAELEEVKQRELTSYLTGLPNRKAYDEADKMPVSASADIDGMKSVNDHHGHAAGDNLIKAMAAALEKAALDNPGVQVYHQSGDEFIAQAETVEQLDRAMKQAQKILFEGGFKYSGRDGTEQVKKGIGFSYGTGSTYAEADSRLDADKKSRKAAGLRTGERDTQPDSREAGVGVHGETGKNNAGNDTGTAETVPDRGTDEVSGVARGTKASPITVEHHDHIKQAERHVDTSPTESQKEAGNYAKGHISWNGLDITIENPQGSTRSGTDANGKAWEVTMPATYGYIKRTEGADGDHIDVYMGKHLDSDIVFVIDQKDLKTGKFDEHKVMLGFPTLREAERIYKAGFSDKKGAERMGAVTPMSVEEFKQWAKTKDTTKPVADTAGRAKAQADMESALAEMGALLRGVVGVENIIPEDKQKFMPVLVKMFDAAFRLGYYDMKKAVHYVREQLAKLDAKAAKWIPKNWMDDAAQQAHNNMPEGFFENQGLFADKPVLESYTNADVLKREAAKAKAEEEAKKEAPAKHVTADQTDLFNTQDSLFNSNREPVVKQSLTTESSTALAGNVKQDNGDELSRNDAKEIINDASVEKVAKENGYSISGIHASTRTEYLVFDNGKDRFQVRFGDHAPGYRFDTGHDIGATGTDAIWDSDTTKGKIIERITKGKKSDAEIKEYGSSKVQVTEAMKHNAAVTKAEKILDSKYRSMRDARRHELGMSRAEWDRSDRYVPGYKELLDAEVDKILRDRNETASLNADGLSREANLSSEAKPDYSGADREGGKDNVSQQATKSKKLEVLKAQAHGKISGDQGAALKELADAGEHAAVDEVLNPESADSGKTWDAMTPSQRFSMLDKWAGAGQSDMGERYNDRKWSSFNVGEKDTLSAVISNKTESPKPVEKSAENVQVDQYTLGAHDDIQKRVREGTISADEFKASFEALLKNKAGIIAELDKFTKPQLFEKYPGLAYRYKNEKKSDVINAIYRDMLHDYALGESLVYGMGRNAMEESLRAMVTSTTDESLAKFAENVKRNKADREAARAEALAGMENPTTLEDFTRLMRSKAEEMGDGVTFQQVRMMLPLEQRIKFDELSAEKTRADRKDRADQQKTDVRVAAQTTDGQVIETKHTKTGEPLFVVKAAERVERDVYNHWNATAKRLGGWYSSYRGGGAVPGFQFKTRDNADAFLSFIGGNVEQAKEAVQARRDAYADDRSQTAVERLTEMADALDEKADASLNQERKANTARRARFAASAEASANSDKALAQTMRNIATGIENGTAKMLNRVRQKVQVEALQGFVRTAFQEQFPRYADQEKNQPSIETADYAKYPNYTAYRSDLAGLGRALLEVEGTMKLGQRLMKVADDVSDAYLTFAKENLHKVSRFSIKGGGELAAFKSKAEAEAVIARSGFKGAAIVLPVKRNENLIILSPSEAIKRGIWEGDNDKRITLSPDFGAEIVEKLGRMNSRGRMDVANAFTRIPWQFENAYANRKRLAAMNIETPAELRSALREFIGLRETAKEPDKIKQMERAMIGRKNDGFDFFPTPAVAADDAIAAADIKPGMTVYEPQAGMGHIADRIREAGVEPDVGEIAHDRRELLEAKGYNLVSRDFMDMRLEDTPNGEGYDRIIMNPPFSDRRDALHVEHAYSLLKPGGRLISIMGEGVFFGKDKKAENFREWLDKVGGTEEKLEEGTFLDPSLPVNTGVSARMVVIDKAADGGPLFSRSNPQTKFYSQLARQIESAPDKVFSTGKSAALWLQANASKLGIRKDELFWSGVTDWMRTQDRVSKSDVLEFLDGNGVQVKEVMLGSNKYRVIDQHGNTSDVFESEGDAQKEADRWIEEAKSNMPEGEELEDPELWGAVEEVVDGDTKFASYQLPGGENYRELLLTLPDARSGDRRATAAKATSDAQQIRESGRRGADILANAHDDIAKATFKDGAQFKSSHFDQPNILAHIRFNERTDADGSRVLFLEELQSDWGQKGKKEGFGATNEDVIRHFALMREEFAAFPNERKEYLRTRATNELGSHVSGVPSAPFVTDTKAWTALALKRMLAYAVDHGFDKVAWTTGEQQAARYDLSKQVKEIEIFPDTNGKYDLELTMPDGSTHKMRDIAEADLEDNIGKDLAAKVITSGKEWLAANKEYRDTLKQSGIPEDELDRLRDKRDAVQTTFSGLDLKVGGEGMKGYYDKIVPQVANDILKKAGGGKVEKIIHVGGPVLTDAERIAIYGKDATYEPTNMGFTITPELRSKVLNEGISLFSQDGKVTEDMPAIPADRVRAIASEFSRDLKHGKLIVVPSVNEIPELVAAAIGDGGVIEGAYVGNGRAYIVANAFNSEQRVYEVVQHELSHMAAEELLDTAEYKRTISSVRMLLKAGNPTLTKLGEEVDKYQPDLPEKLRVKEILAKAVETGEYKKLGALKRFIADIMRAFKRIARSMGINTKYVNTMTEPEVMSAMRGAMRALYRETQTLDDALKESEQYDQKERIPRTEYELALKEAGLFSRGSAQYAKQSQTRKSMENDISLIDKAFALPFKLVGWNSIVSKGTDALLSKLGELVPETVKAGIVDNYGLDPAYIDSKAEMKAREAAQNRKAHGMIEMLAGLNRAESRVAYYWMQEKPESAGEKQLLEQLPEQSREVLAKLKKLISDLGKEAVRLGQMSNEAYQRNNMAYLHRTYAKHILAEESAISKFMRARAMKVKGDQYKGRGIFDEVPMSMIGGETISRKLKAWQADKQFVGEKMIRFERRDASTEAMEPLTGMTSKPLGKLREVVYWPASEAVPAKYGDWVNAGTFEVRDTKGDKLVLWRDLTREERNRLGELDEVRYAVAQTLQAMVHDIEVGRFLEWTAKQYGKAMPEGKEVEASESMIRAYQQHEWVQVPTTNIPGSKTKKYGALAGLYVNGAVWNDIRQAAGGKFTPWGDSFASVLRFWKQAKTVWSPTVHMNNVMANFVMADWNDMRAVDLADAMRVWARSDKEGYKQLFERFQDSGALGGMFQSNEAMRDEIKKRLEEMKDDLTGKQEASNEMGTMAKVLHLMSMVTVQPVKTYANVTAKAYQAEDEFFRLAIFLKAIRHGKSDIEAGRMARHAFLNYDINAPWIQYARQTVLPFVSFFYRAAPMLFNTAKNKPWKIAKLVAFAYMLNALGYALAGGGDDEDKDRKLMPEEKSGSVWWLVPKMIRMPWNHEDGSPVFLDIRRWVPVGDIVDMDMGAGMLPPWVTPAGFWVSLGEVLGNYSMFSKKEITNDTDSGTEAAEKRLDYLFKSMMPNVPLPNPINLQIGDTSINPFNLDQGSFQSYGWSGIEKAVNRRENAIGEVRTVPQAIANTLGIKVGTYPRDNMEAAAVMDSKRKDSEIQNKIKTLARDYSKLDNPSPAQQAIFERGIQRQKDKIQNLSDDLERKLN